ncbi:MAG: hypothetical protein E7626_05525 [Ruminococcaceae bacterium]|nr:hypothetical protein [Oscillospiraceae bacterium]
MELKQLICFSWNENDKKKGYHVFARSNGIDDIDVATIMERLAYRIPKAITAATVAKLAETSRLLGYPTRGDSGLHFVVQRDIDDLFPVDEAFFVLPSGNLCAAKVTYCGVDYRLSVWGNYIIHAYIFPYSGSFPPARVLMTQRFKKYILPRELLKCDVQRPLPTLEIDETDDGLDSLAELVKARGVASLTRMLDCVFASIHRDVDILINGTEEEISFWMYALESLLPQEIVSLLSFSTCRFAEQDGSPFRIKRVVKKLGDARSYKLPVSDGEYVCADPKNKIFSENATKLQLSGLMAYLLLSDPAEARVLRDLIGTYIETKGVIDSDDICLIYRLARTDIYDSISEIELCEALGGPVLITFGKSTVDRVIEKYLDLHSELGAKIKLYELLATYHSDPERIMDKLFYKMLDDLVRGRIAPRDALDTLTEDNFGKATFSHILRDLEKNRPIFESAMGDSATRSFVFRLLFAGFYDLSEQSSADMLIELIPHAIRNDERAYSKFPQCISEMIDIVEFDEMTYRRVIYAYYDYCRTVGDFAPWCELVTLLFEQGRKLSSEAGLCAFILRELDYGALIGYMMRGDNEAECVLSLLGYLRRFGAVSERTHSNFVYAKFGEFLSKSADARVIAHVVGALKNENEKLLEVLEHYAQSTDKRLAFDVYKKEIGNTKSTDDVFLVSMHSSSVKYIATALVAAEVTDRASFNDYIEKWYSKGYYGKCFQKAFQKTLRIVPENESWEFLNTVFSICKGSFAERRSDFELFASALSEKIELYFARESEPSDILSEMRDVAKACGAKLPYACECILCTKETLEQKGDISLNLAKEFAEKASENLKDVYVRTYGVRLLGLCSSDMDVETISAAVWLAVVSSDRDNFKKLLKGAARMSSATVRILLTRVTDALIIKKDYDKVEEMITTLAGAMKTSDYISLKEKTLAKYSWEEYGNIFFLAEEKFGYFAKKRLNKQK